MILRGRTRPMSRLLLVILLWWVLILPTMIGCGDDDDDSGGDDADDEADDDDTADDDDDDDTTPPADPGELGPYSVAYVNLQFPDPSSGKNQPLRVYFPSADNGVTIVDDNGPRPLIIFGPGFSAPMNLYFSYGEHLASYGYVVALRNNYVISHVGLAQSTSAIIDWIQDQESQPASLFHGKLDFDHIGMSGHSMGGKISLLTAYYDDRVKASATIDPVDMNPLPTPAYPSVTPELMPDIHIPTLFIGSSDGGACAPQAENYHQYFLVANEPSTEIEIINSGHVTFCDLPDAIVNAATLICPTGGGDFEQIRMLTSRYVTAFYKVVFDGKTEYNYYLTGEGMANDVAGGLVATDHKP
jgi:pimeloyl-ACP methyl ester carboxylesterase